MTETLLPWLTIWDDGRDRIYIETKQVPGEKVSDSHGGKTVWKRNGHNEGLRIASYVPLEVKP